MLMAGLKIVHCNMSGFQSYNWKSIKVFSVMSQLCVFVDTVGRLSGPLFETCVCVFEKERLSEYNREKERLSE